jgi:hypothetical protein
VLTALITGFLVPHILKSVEEKRTRQSKIVESQIKFLEDLSNLLWKWRYASVKVTFYGGANGDMKNYDIARAEYDKDVWDLLQSLRAEISRSRRFVSEKTYIALLSLYDEIKTLDRDMPVSIESKDLDVKLQQKYRELNIEIVNTFSQKIDDILDVVANELKLKTIPHQ